jgi:hypothetical protein
MENVDFEMADEGQGKSHDVAMYHFGTQKNENILMEKRE